MPAPEKSKFASAISSVLLAANEGSDSVGWGHLDKESRSALDGGFSEGDEEVDELADLYTNATHGGSLKGTVNDGTSKQSLQAK
ncbi:hypothetical protein GN958_ATG20139 [Phytophthora infestans]|uniref:Uncharacterized protein n=1 Tax=Phytophthora infestans TaxID=4787 RepID=A0A8S9TP53_PHYIN|nr:hypothetical protein GN958_ATG20139 [Phytophthora infestans]